MSYESCSKRPLYPKIDPITVLKKVKGDLEISKCFFCEGSETAAGSGLSSATGEGKSKVVEVALKRKSLNDTSSLGVIERILATIGTGENINLD
jgi:hypothetical protein